MLGVLNFDRMEGNPYFGWSLSDGSVAEQRICIASRTLVAVADIFSNVLMTRMTKGQTELVRADDQINDRCVSVAQF